LTNRHVVGAGPFWGYCIFDNHEEVRNRRRKIAVQLQSEKGSSIRFKVQ
jgi:hypothetical protein